MSAATAGKLAWAEYTREEAAAEQRSMREEHEARVRSLSLLTRRQRQAKHAWALRVLPLHLAVDAREELEEADRLSPRHRRDVAPVIPIRFARRERGHSSSSSSSIPSDVDEGRPKLRAADFAFLDYLAESVVRPLSANNLHDVDGEPCKSR